MSQRRDSRHDTWCNAILSNFVFFFHSQSHLTQTDETILMNCFAEVNRIYLNATLCSARTCGFVVNTLAFFRAIIVYDISIEINESSVRLWSLNYNFHTSTICVVWTNYTCLNKKSSGYWTWAWASMKNVSR